MRSSGKAFHKMGAKILRMPGIMAIGILLVGVIATVGCSAQASQNPIKATWVKPQVSGETVSVPLSAINSDKIIHFSVGVALGKEIAFMAYELDGKTYVRSNVCPPCRSIGFSLNRDTLVCDTCKTTFKAKTGDGISGACVAYPKAAVPYQINGSDLVMRSNDLQSAYQNTLEPGWP